MEGGIKIRTHKTMNPHLADPNTQLQRQGRGPSVCFKFITRNLRLKMASDFRWRLQLRLRYDNVLIRSNDLRVRGGVNCRLLPAFHLNQIYIDISH